MRGFARKIYNRMLKKFGIKQKKLTAIQYWQERAKHYGKRSVFNIGHSEDEMEAVTRMQKDEIFPFLKECIKGDESIILDVGCGPGRFTPDLARVIQGHVIGIDPIQSLLDLAKNNKNNQNVEYRLMDEGNFPVKDSSIDIVWICLVLGGIIDENILKNTVLEIKRVLKQDGLLFLIENTDEKESGDYWKFRSIKYYQTIFDFVELKYLSGYIDKGEKISILAGRKNV